MLTHLSEMYFFIVIKTTPFSPPVFFSRRSLAAGRGWMMAARGGSREAGEGRQQADGWFGVCSVWRRGWGRPMEEFGMGAGSQQRQG